MYVQLGALALAKILAVDDSPSVRQLVSMSLRAKGHDVVTADDGTSALEFAQSESVNLVITDVHMPEMDGISLVHELRKLENYRYIPLLFLTTESSLEFKQKGKEAGGTGWIVKPFDADREVRSISGRVA